MLKGVLQYQVRRKIGEGGMGVVYEGWDERLGRAVAIKTFHEVAASTEARDRLWREARSLARVAHPRVCQIFDVLEEGSDLFLVLELLDGVSLANRLAGGPLPTAEAANIEQQILEALEALHALGITHRDLKPSNIFLTPHGVKLLDFGLARSVMPTAGGPASDSTALTAPEMVVGTPQYMAPEQAKGGGAGPAADIFAAGCILYEMLSGKRPFDGDSRIDILYAVLHHEPPPLSGPREIEAIDVVVRQAINKRPEERYPSARSMLDALGAVGATGAKVTARTVTRLIALPFRLLKKDEETDFLAYSLPEAITSSLSGIDDLIVRSGLLAARFEGALDPKQIGAEAGVDAILSGSLMRAGDQIRLVCQLIEAPSGTVKWSETITSSVRDLFRIQDELAQRSRWYCRSASGKGISFAGMYLPALGLMSTIFAPTSSPPSAPWTI